ncbi:MAG: FkbM family methyltransferase [Cyanobacteriota bacterium]
MIPDQCGTPLQFIHIPKCGRTSVWRYMNETRPPRADLYQARHKTLSKTLCSSAAAVVKTRDPRDRRFPHFFTVIRPPVDRILSLHFHICHQNHRLNSVYEELRGASLTNFLEIGLQNFPESLRNVMCSFLAPPSGLLTSLDLSLLEKAKQGLAMIGLVGYTDEMETVYQYISRLHGYREASCADIPFPRYRSSNNRRVSREDLGPEELSFINELVSDDLKLYEYARAMGQSVAAEENAADSPCMPDLQTIKVFDRELLAPNGHIYCSPSLPPLYDCGPWSYIGYILRGEKNISLIDVGANIGDSYSYWRHFFDGSAVCVEPSPYFFNILSRNLSACDSVTLVNSLVAAGFSPAEIVFCSGRSTGSTSVRSLSGNTAPTSHHKDVSGYEGQLVTIEELISILPVGSKFVFKTDTDGFDQYILSELLDAIRKLDLNSRIPIIFAEGPSLGQLAAGNFDAYLDVCESIMQLGYKCTVFSNAGHVISESMSSRQQLRSIASSLMLSRINKKPFASYLDFVFFHEGMGSDLWWTSVLDRKGKLIKLFE